jgi:hypothetical protein
MSDDVIRIENEDLPPEPSQSEAQQVISIDIGDLPAESVAGESSQNIVIDLPARKEPKEEPVNCTFCSAPIQPGDEVVSCTRCNSPHHLECWKLKGGCSALGCGSRQSGPYIKRSNEIAL